jgi:hypothetical protein
VRPRSLGTFEPSEGTTTTLTARRVLGPGTVTAAIATEVGTISAGATVRVTPGALRIGSIRYLKRQGALLVSASAVDAAGRPVSGATVALLVKRDGRRHYTGRGSTGASGRTLLRVPARRPGCFTTTIRRVSAAGFVWNGRTPRNRFCT